MNNIQPKVVAFSSSNTRDFYKGTSFRWANRWEPGKLYTNDTYFIDCVTWANKVWVCISSHYSSEDSKPAENSTYWQQAVSANVSGLPIHVGPKPPTEADYGEHYENVLWVDTKTDDYRVYGADEIDANFYTKSASDERYANNSVVKKYIDDAIESAREEYIEKVTYSELVARRDAEELIPGVSYCIIDYRTSITTTPNVRYMNNMPFNIIVTAASEKRLLEEARLVWPEGIECVTEDGKSITGWDYSKWKVWYTVYNSPQYSWAASEGKGVIYRMIDDRGNDCPYDFKNIQFKYNNKWYYTFIDDDISMSIKTTHDNVIKCVHNDVDGTELLPHLIFRSANTYCNTIFLGNDVTTTLVAKDKFFQNEVNTPSLQRLIAEDSFVNNKVGGVEKTSITCKDAVKFCNIIGNVSNIVLDSGCYYCTFDGASRDTTKELTITAASLIDVCVYGPGNISILDTQSNTRKRLSGSEIYLGTIGSNICLTDTREHSVKKCPENIRLRIPNGGSTLYEVDLEDHPLNSNYTLDIALDSQGNVKKWCSADLIYGED